MSKNTVVPVTLEDNYVIIKPMALGHVEGLYHAGKFSDIWEWTTEPYCLTMASTLQWITQQLETAKNGSLLPFVIIDKSSQKIVGSTSYLNVFLDHKALEIGYTFLSPLAQRTHINRRCKYLLMCHAFEALLVNRVAFQTHEKNSKSRNAIEGIGATYEGMQRDCRIQYNGSIRSSVFYSIIKSEWPDAKVALIEKINHVPTGSAK